MQTEELVAGRELDALVAEKMGWRRVRAEPWQCLNYSPEHNHDRDHCAWIKPGDSDDTRWDGNKPPHYSTEISAAWEVLDEMVWRVGTANIRLDMEDYGRGAMNDGGAERAAWVTIGDYTAFGPAPLAICKAALAAVNG